MTTAELVTLTGQRRPFVALAASGRPVEVHVGAQSVRIAAGDASVSLGWQRQGAGALLTGALLDPRADMLLLPRVKPFSAASRNSPMWLWRRTSRRRPWRA